MELVATIVVIGLAIAGAWFAFERLGPLLGGGALATVARFVLAVVLVALAVIVLWIVLDERDSGAAAAGRAGNAGRVPAALVAHLRPRTVGTAGVAGNGTCDQACQMAWLARRAGVML